MEIIHPIYVALPGMEVYLNKGFFGGIYDRPPNKHTHPCFEIVCTVKEQETYFHVIPPLAEHFSKTVDEGWLCSFLFSFTDDCPEDICQIIGKVNKETKIKDSFDGLLQIQAIRNTVPCKDIGADEQIKAEFRLFFVKLARAFYSEDKTKEVFSQTLDNERIALLEHFFNFEMRYPDCSKQQLAAKIGVCERQLTRILKETYNSTFSAVLLKSRMNMAQAMMMTGEKTTEEIAEAVGYTSASVFRKAYKKFFGYYPTRKQDML